MKEIIPLAIAIVFIVYGFYSIIYPSKVRNSMNRNHKEGLTDFGVSSAAAESWVKKSVVQKEWVYRISGIIMTVFGGLLFYAVVRTMLQN